MNSSSGFTIMEILIVISLLTILAIGLIFMLNPKRQMEKLWDTQRKHDVALVQQSFTDYYGQKGHFPKDTDICLDQAVEENGICTCHICGLSDSGQFSPYLKKLFCDPEYPKKNYVLQYQCGDNPQWFRVCVSLRDPLPGFSQNADYNYGTGSGADVTGCYNIENKWAPPTPTPTDYLQLTSPTPTPTDVIPTLVVDTPPVSNPTATPTPTTEVSSPTNTPVPTLAACTGDHFYCLRGPQCNDCGGYSNCTRPGSCDSPLQLYTDIQCQNACQY